MIEIIIKTIESGKRLNVLVMKGQDINWAIATAMAKQKLGMENFRIEGQQEWAA